MDKNVSFDCRDTVVSFASGNAAVYSNLGVFPQDYHSSTLSLQMCSSATVRSHEVEG